ncbi:VPS9 domain-containing protein 1 isoform X2 [Xiphophorus hellerii]|uniref:VPS9 domain-containing protein 1 isoform X2 n=1 Tax=Xiphophorus hellerii TaxID=8084 RepID=UPI0013B46C1E|nr:VPS9 domain-containing protein 1 isoform X2 [Xiphophorus hellerii]
MGKLTANTCEPSTTFHTFFSKKVLSWIICPSRVSLSSETQVEVERMLRLAEQCLDRAKSFIGKRSVHPVPPVLQNASCSSADQSEAEAGPKAGDRASAAEGQVDASSRFGLSDDGGQPSSFPPPDVFQRQQTAASHDSSRKTLTPVEEASRQNQKLQASYEARVARLAPGQASQKTSLTLSLQRQMMENLIIARARQDALQRKVEERRQRLQDEANRRFAASGALTAEEQEQRLLYSRVLEYELDHDWPKQWRTNIKKNPDSSLVLDLLSYLLRSDHPLVELLRKHQFRIYNQLYPIVTQSLPQSLPQSPALLLRSSRSVHARLSPERQPTGTGSSLDGEDPVQRDDSFEDLEHFLSQLDCGDLRAELTFDPSIELEQLELRALKEHLKAIVRDVHGAVDQLLSLCLLSFDCLNTATFKDLSLGCIEEAFFTPLWSPLLALFRRVLRERELLFQRNMALYCSASPAEVGVPLKLFPQDPGALQGSYPYQVAVQELKLLVRDRCPQRKLDCVVRTLRLICGCAEDYRNQQGGGASRAAAIGADDLLPILSFVALRCQCPQLLSECAALEEFIHESFLIGEEGYCLTSLQSALAYVESLPARADLADPE